MAIKTVRVNVGVTKNMGNYESLRLDESVEVEVGEGEKLSDVINAARDYLTDKINKDAVIVAQKLREGK